MARNRKHHYWETGSYSQDEEDIEESYIEVYVTAVAVKHNKRKKLGITEQDMFRVIYKAHEQNDTFHRQLRNDLFYAKIQASGRGAGAQSTRYVVATKKDGKYFILDFYKKAEQEYPPRSDINNYLARSVRLLDATDAEIATMLKERYLFRILPYNT